MSARLFLKETDLGQFRIGIGHPRKGLVVNAHRHAEQCVPDDQAGVVVRDVSVFGATSGVADGIHRLVGGAQ